MMDRDNITRTGARAPGVERHFCRSNCGAQARNTSGTERRFAVCKRWARRVDANHAARHVDAVREGPPEMPALKPCRGKPATRNFRGDDGDVGIIRSPVRAIALPDRGYLTWCVRGTPVAKWHIDG